MAINPYEVAAKYGYDAQTFANDPNFENYWKNKTEAELLSGLKARRDWGEKDRTNSNSGNTGGNNGSSNNSSSSNGTTGWYDPANGLPTSPGHGVQGTPPGNTGGNTGNNNNSEEEIDYTEYDRMIEQEAADNGYSPSQIATLKMIFRGEYGNKTYSMEEISGIISQSAEDADKSLKPYYDKMEASELEDLKTGLANIREESAMYKEREAIQYTQTLANTKKNLRTRGLTFSGQSRGTLGSEGALNSKGMEGTVPESRRLSYESKIADWKNRGETIGRAGERLLGSDALGGIEGFDNPYANGSTTYNSSGRGMLYNPVGDIATDESGIALDRLKEKEILKWNNVNRYNIT